TPPGFRQNSPRHFVQISPLQSRDDARRFDRYPSPGFTARRAKEDAQEDSAIGLWDRLFNKVFEDNTWIVTPQKRQPNAEKADFIIGKAVPNNQFVEA
ncbi:hypothetical protein FQN55_008167, partial [Onygenales sp. PD_40]